MNRIVTSIFSGITNFSRKYGRPGGQEPQEGLGASYNPRQWMEDYYDAGAERAISTAGNKLYRTADYKNDQEKNA